MFTLIMSIRCYILLTVLSIFSQTAQATAYVFPGSLPSTCSGTNGSYTCTSLSLSYHDSITVNSPLPATITVNNNLSLPTSYINSNGSAANLNLVVTGTLSIAYQATINANITAASLTDSGNVTYGGNITTSGATSFAYGSQISGAVTAASLTDGGNVTYGSTVTISGSASFGYGSSISGKVSAASISDNGSLSYGGGIVCSGNVSLGYGATVTGSITSSSGYINISQASTVSGNITGTSGAVSIGYSATVSGNVTTTSGAITFGQASRGLSCVTSSSSAKITLNYWASVNSVCCGATCSNSCVSNNSGNSMPSLCGTMPAAYDIYHMDEASWVGAGGEVKDSGAGNFSGTAKGGSGTTASTANVAPAIAGTAGTCNYGVFNRTYNQYVQLPSNYPSLNASGSAFSVTAWINTTNNSQSNQWVFNNGGNDNNSFYLSLGDNGAGTLTFYTPGNFFNSNVSTGNVISNNTWYFVAAIADIPNQMSYLYVYDSSGDLVGSASQNTNNWWNNADGGSGTIGGYSSNNNNNYGFNSNDDDNNNNNNNNNNNYNSYGFSGYIDEVQVYTSAITPAQIATLVSQTHACSVTNGVLPGSFNCVEVGGATSSDLYTKLSGAAFSLDVVALTSGGAVDSNYVNTTSKNVKLELVEGPVTTACANRTAVSAQTVTFASTDQGRHTTPIAATDTAYADLGCRITDANQSPNIVSCSADDFAIRPYGLTVSSSASADSSGASGSNTPAIKTGASFTLTATANPSTTSTVTDTGYSGTPALNNSQVLAHSGAIENGSVTGSFNSASAGVASGSFSYSEAGYFALQTDGVYDSGFTSIDSAKSDCTPDFSNTLVGGKYGCNFGNTAETGYFGRFIPDHFLTTLAGNGNFAHACSGFSYNGQTISYSTIPTATVTAYNSSGAVTKNYTGNFMRLAASQFALSYPSADAKQKGVDGVNYVELTATPGAVFSRTLTTNCSTGNTSLCGTMTFTLGNDTFTYSRENNALINPFSNAVNVTISSATDSDSVSTFAGNTTVLQPSGESIYYGRVHLQNASGSELSDLNVPMYVEYYSVYNFIPNILDQCSVATLTITDPLTTDSLTPANTCVWGSLSGAVQCSGSIPSGETYIQGSSLNPLTNQTGSFNLYLKAPGVTGPLTVNAAVQNWLKYNWTGSGIISPSSTATFGIYPGSTKQIYFKEVY